MEVSSFLEGPLSRRNIVLTFFNFLDEFRQLKYRIHKYQNQDNNNSNSSDVDDELSEIFYQMTEVLLGLDQVDSLPLLELLQSENSIDGIMEKMVAAQ